MQYTEEKRLEFLPHFNMINGVLENGIFSSDKKHFAKKDDRLKASNGLSEYSCIVDEIIDEKSFKLNTKDGNSISDGPVSVILDFSQRGRRSGKTTRLIDEAIQYLFKNKTLYLFTDIGLSSTPSVTKEKTVFIDPDHRFGNNAQRDFIHRILRRLEIEHAGCTTLKREQSYIKISVKE